MSERKAGHHLTLLEGASELFPALIEAVDASVREVRLETYIFSVQGSGESVAQALLRAAARGVAVFLVMDGVGSAPLPAPWRERFDAAGVQWRMFRPPGRLGLLLPNHWRRLHRKLCVVDGQTAFCGGINVLDDYFDPNHGVLAAPRFDFAVRVSGPLVQSAHAVMVQFWWRLLAAHSVRQTDWRGAWLALQQAVRQRQGTTLPVVSSHEGALAELVLRDNVRHRNRIERAYRKALGEARSEIILANAYFLPGRKFRRALVHAAQRGVRVRLLLQGRYEYFMQFHATRALYAKLLAAGVEIHEYRSSFLHAKVAVIDGRWATVGSSNIDPLSLLLAREANVVVQDATFARALGLELERALKKDAQQIDPQQFSRRGLRQKVLDRLALVVMGLLLLLTGHRY